MEDFVGRGEFDQYSKRMTEHNERQDARLKVIEENEKQITSLTMSVEKMATNMEHMVMEQKTIGERLKAIEDEPKENAKTLRASVLSAIGGAVAAAVVAAILSMIGG